MHENLNQLTEKIISQLINPPSITLYNILLNHIQEAIYFVDQQRNITFWNHGAEKITGYNRSEIQGKRCPANIILQLDNQNMSICQKNCPILKTMQDGSIRNLTAFLQHKAGHRIPVTMQTFPIRNNDNQITGAAALFSESIPKVAIPQNSLDLQRMDMMDSLTGLGNKTYIEMQLKSRFAEVKKYSFSFGLLMVDIDNFKKFNEVHGRHTGDKIIKSVGQTLYSNIRFFDTAGRWKEDKFILIILNITETKLDVVANKLRLLVSQSHIREGMHLIGVTVSIGATLARSLDKPETIIYRAERLSKHSKWLGKNRVSTKINNDTFKD